MTDNEKNKFEKIVSGTLNKSFLAWVFLLLAVLWGGVKFGNDALSLFSKFTSPTANEHQEIQSRILPIYFEFGSYRINKESVTRLNEYTPQIMKAEPKRILIEGHVVENEPDINIPLSRRRAEEVADYLI